MKFPKILVHPGNSDTPILVDGYKLPPGTVIAQHFTVEPLDPTWPGSRIGLTITLLADEVTVIDRLNRPVDGMETAMSDLDAAVEAAAKAITTAMLGRMTPHTRKQYERIARAAVEAVTPIIAAQALRDAADLTGDEHTHVTATGEVLIPAWVLRDRADRIEKGLP